MARGIRKAATQKLPAGVKYATQVPLLIIPAAPRSTRADGTDGTLRRRDTGDRDNAVAVRYPACCDEHKSAIKVASLATDSELAAMCSRFSQHHGHGKLYAHQARIEWIACEDKVPCQDCLDEHHEKQAAA
jgi:hypothetical protein